MFDNKWTKKLIKQCMTQGADAAEIYLEKERNLRVEIREGEIETIQETETRGVGFRVFVKGRMGFAHCNDFSDQSIKNTIENVVKFAENVSADKNNVLPDDPGITKIDGLYDAKIAGIPLDKKIKMAIDLENLAIKDPRITKSAGSSFSEGDVEVILANSNGLNKSERSTYCGFGVSVVAEKGEQKTSGSDYCYRRSFSQIKSMKEIAERAAKKAYSMLDPRMVKTQRAAVIFDPDVARSLLGGIIRAINGERVLQGASFLRDSLGKMVASSLFTVIDDGTLSGGLSSTPFDGEGVPTQRQVIIEKGELKGFIYNTITAKRAGVKSTGNASRGGFTSIPGIGVHNFYVAAGPHKAEEIIKKTRNGLLLKGVTGYGINPVNGNFSGGASGFWIKNGKIIFPVKGLTIAGNANEMLNSIDMVADDLDLHKSLTAPTIRIPDMQIGGE